MNESGLSRSEIIAMVGGVLLAVGLFLTWYKIDRLNAINGIPASKQDTFTGWEVHTIARWFLLAGALAPLILAWIIWRGHALSWPRGEMTAVSAIAALGLILYMTLVNKPGVTSGLTHLRWGVLVSLLGAALMLAGSATRASAVERPRKPPGTI
jgi:hypothetical protein